MKPTASRASSPPPKRQSFPPEPASGVRLIPTELVIVLARWDGRQTELAWHEGFIAARDAANEIIKRGEADCVEVRQKKSGRLLHVVRVPML